MANNWFDMVKEGRFYAIDNEDGCVIVENRRCEPQEEWINERAHTKTARFSFEITRVLIPQKSLLDEQENQNDT